MHFKRDVDKLQITNFSKLSCLLFLLIITAAYLTSFKVELLLFFSDK
jgi:hypothetical protein